MAQQEIQLRKLRDFGENINDTFLFLRQNFKPLLKSFFAICSIFMVGLAIFLGLHQSRQAGLIASIFSNRMGRLDNAYEVFPATLMLLILFMTLTFISMNVVIGAYIKYYLEHDGEKPTIDDIWLLFKRYFFRILLYSIPYYILTTIGFLFCFAPGFYFWVMLAPFPVVVMIENTNFASTYDRCRQLIRQNFWPSFGLYIVAYLIFYISTEIFRGASLVLTGVTAYFSTEDMRTGVAIATSFLSIFAYCFYIVYFISVALNYFSLVEKHDGTGLLGRIDKIGQQGNLNQQSEEQY